MPEEMPESVQETGVEELVNQCLACLDKMQLQEANSALSEAIARAPNNLRVKDAQEVWRLHERNTNLLKLCKTFAERNDAETAKRAMVAAAQDDFEPHIAAQAIGALLEQDTPDQSNTAEIINIVCSRPSGGKALATMLHDQPTKTLEGFYRAATASIDAVTQTLNNIDLWVDGNEQRTAAVNLFPLFLSKLNDADQARKDAAMRSVARLMAMKNTDLAPLINSKNIVALLSFLDVDCSIVQKSQAILTVAKLIEANSDKGQKLLKDFIVSRMDDGSTDDLVASISVAGAMFPVISEFASHLFLSPGFPEQLVKVGQNHRSSKLRRAALDLMSSACINKECRSKISDICVVWLKQIVKSSNERHEAVMAGLVLSKLSEELRNKSKGIRNNSETQSDLISMFKETIVEYDQPEAQVAIEGLAYNSTDPNVKEQLANDPKLLKAMIRILSKPEHQGPTLFGGLTVLSNLMIYSPDLTPEERRMAKLKAYANQNELLSDHPLNDDEHVKERCRKVLDAGVTSILRTRSASPAALQLISLILLSLSKERTHCGIMAQQGMFDIILRLAYMDQEDAGNILPHVRRQSAQALARVLITINPALLKSRSEGAIEKCIGPLSFLLSHLEPSDPYCAFDALRALTNIASLWGDEAKLVDEKCYPSIAVYLESSRSALQQAAAECVANLSVSPSFMLSHYLLSDEEDIPYGPGFDRDDPSANRKEVHFLRLISLTKEEARGTRVAALGALAAMTGTAPGRRMLIRAPDGLEHVFTALIQAQTTEAGEQRGLSGKDALVGDVDIRLRAWCILQDIFCNTEDAEVQREYVRFGVIKLLHEGVERLPGDEQLKQMYLGFTQPLEQRLKEVFKNRICKGVGSG